MKNRDYVAMWKALSDAEQLKQTREQSQLYRRATALMAKKPKPVVKLKPKHIDTDEIIANTDFDDLQED